MKISYVLLLSLAILQVVVLLLFQQFVEPNKESYDKALSDVQQTEDLRYVRVRAGAAMSQLYVRNRAAHDLWVWTAVVAAANMGLLIALMALQLRASALKKRD
jgi:hypothetical protein